MKSTDKRKVIIIGAGPAGMASALALAQWNISSIIIEKETSPGRHPKAHEISGRTIEILNQLGIKEADLVKEASDQNVASSISFGISAREPLAEINLKSSQPGNLNSFFYCDNPYLNISQTEVERVMRSVLKESKKITLLTGHEFLELSQSADDISVTVKTPSGRQIEIMGTYLLCCDGATSLSRKQLGIKMTGPTKIQDFMNVFFTNNLKEKLQKKSKLYFIFKPSAAGTFIAHHPERRWVYHFPLIDGFERREDFSHEDLKDRIKSALDLPDFEPEITSVSSWRMTAQVAEKFRAGRAFLVGDCAHRFPPTGGLGLNSGVADAHNLAFKMAMMMRNLAPPGILDSYEQERRPVIEFNCQASKENFEKLFEVPRAMGLSMTAFRLIVKATRVTGLKMQKRILLALRRFADRKVQRTINSEKKRQSIEKAVNRQRGHFDRIGIELGYSYQSGYLSRQAEKETSTPGLTYEFNFSAGSRLPNITKNGESLFKKGIYQKFMLVSIESSKKLFGSIDAGGLIETVILPPVIELGEKKYKREGLAKKYQLDYLLVRPDHHIAATGREEVEKFLSHLVNLNSVKRAS